MAARTARFLLVFFVFPFAWLADKILRVDPPASWPAAMHWVRTGKGLHVPTMRTADKPAVVGRRHTQPRTGIEEQPVTNIPTPTAKVDALAAQLAQTFTAAQLAQLDAESLDRPDMSTGPWQTVADAINRAAATKEHTR